MYHYNFGTLVVEKQKEMEKVSNEAWKFAGYEKKSFTQTIINKMFSKRTKQQTNHVCIDC